MSGPGGQRRISWRTTRILVATDTPLGRDVVLVQGVEPSFRWRSFAIELMELAGFCRNCLSRWYREAAEERGGHLTDPDAREIVYGMPYEEWKARFQSEPSAG